MRRRLERLAAEKADGYRRRPETIAVAVTGSVPRGMTWPGSDVDLWVFRDGPEGFEHGVEGGIYWEADIRPGSILGAPLSDDLWLDPPPLGQESDRLFEALWGCRPFYDPTGRLTALKGAIDGRMNDPAWRAERIRRFVGYGRECLIELAAAEPIPAIVGARAVATDYALAAWWMQRGRLLFNTICLPERLAEAGGPVHLYRSVFNLGGRGEADHLLAAFQAWPEPVRGKYAEDLAWEWLPAYRLGMYDGVVRFIRQGAPRWEGTERALPLLGLEPDLVAQKERVVADTASFLDAAERE